MLEIFFKRSCLVKMNRLKSLDEIAISHGIQLKKDLALINKSYHENNQIVQGDYDSEYRKIMDFFHELTCLLCDDYFRKLEKVIKDRIFFLKCLNIVLLIQWSIVLQSNIIILIFMT